MRAVATVWRAGITGVVTALVVGTLVGTAGAVLDAEPARAATGEDTSSAVTLTTRDDALNPDGAPFPDLAVTFSQTKNLVAQGIRISWTGADLSSRPDGSTHGGENFLQIAQCWGEDPLRPGYPDRRTCQYGGGRAAGSERDGFTQLDKVDPQDQKYTADLGPYAYTGIPFVARNAAGIVDEKQAPAEFVLDNFVTAPDGTISRKPESEMADLSNNQFFTRYTTNEVKWAPAGADGSGSVPFEVQTTMQSTALGCGTPVIAADGTATGQPCWLVIIPRGKGDSGESTNSKSGLWWDAWEHSLAVKLDFKPIGVRCQIGAAERQLAGSELVAAAVASWQPQLCAGENGAPFVLSQANEADALLRAAGTAPSPLAFTSRPLDMTRATASTDPLAYAPVAISGLAVSFAVDRQPNPLDATPEQRARSGLPMTELKLTPRLVAKLLTASYVDALPRGADKSSLGWNSAGKEVKNPRTMLADPDFLEINDPEWAVQIIAAASVADLLVPSGRSDAAVRLWEYVLADEEASAWLAGEPDPWGMVVNPWYSTNVHVVEKAQSGGSALSLPSESFPKADPIEKPDETSQGNGTGAINLVTWRPFTGSLAEGAYNVLRGDGLLLGNWEPNAAPPRFGRSIPDVFGSQRVLGLTSTPAAALYQTATAALRNPAGEFVAPTTQGFTAAAAAMTPTTEQPAVLWFDPAGSAAARARTAYPLTIPVYAALNPAQTDAVQRATYANLIRYAAVEGQQPGTDVGQLPAGYAPLPKSWADQSLVAAAAIEKGAAPAQTPATGGNAPPPANRPSAAPLAPVPALPGTAATAPVATGQAAGPLAGAATPKDPNVGVGGAAVPIGLLAGLVAAAAVPIVPRLRRRT